MILQAMLTRLYASLVHGPSMNAKPHKSRQRVDLTALECLAGRSIQGALAELLAKGSVEFPARVPKFEAPDYPEAEWSDAQRQAKAAAERQRKLLEKLRSIAVDAQDYFNDHGESALAIGFPVLALPPAGSGAETAKTSRIVAPVAFVAVEMQVRTGTRPGVTLRCLGEGAELLVPNPALLAWLEQQTGQPSEDLFQDEEGADPWRELGDIVAHVVRALKLEDTPPFAPETPLAAVPDTADLPKVASLLPSVVLGLFPLVNQAPLRDTQWMLANEAQLAGPVTAFLRPEAIFAGADAPLPEAEQFTVQQQAQTARDFAGEWLATHADPCQSAAVRAARSAGALVVHGPPGTGKSQTIANMIGDHLARGERVLFVCDKRTALDVVKYRLDALGLGEFCGIVHDPTHDRRELYSTLRARLEALAESGLPADPAEELGRANAQLQGLHRELSAYRTSLHVAPPGERSFHDLLGSWLEHAGDETIEAIPPVPELRLLDLETHRTSIDEILRRAARGKFVESPFREAIGITLGDFLALDPQELARRFAALTVAADAADHLHFAELIELDPEADLEQQAAQREEAAQILERLVASGAGATCARFAQASPESVANAARDLAGAAEWRAKIAGVPLERELVLALGGVPALREVSAHLLALKTWEPIAQSFSRFFAFGAKKAAKAALAPLGLPLATGLERATALYRGLRFRLLLSDFVQREMGTPNARPLLEDDELERGFVAIEGALQLRQLMAHASLRAAAPYLTSTLADLGQWGENVGANLRGSAAWARAVRTLLSTAEATGVLNAHALSQLRAAAGSGAARSRTAAWESALDDLENLVRMNAALASLPGFLHTSTLRFATGEVELEAALAALRKVALENTLRERLRTDAALAGIDGDRIESAFATYLDLSQKKQTLVRAAIGHRWLARQRQRLLALTGTQLNKHGVALKQRLFIRGKKALRLRQMVATGAGLEGGDPLYDLCPVWMASPSTVAQVFPRESAFDVVIFDEASQCRLEEALPVLLRGRRVVVAGDPKQLPPTRFFESGVADSGQTDPETGEELFLQQQSEAEDLLSAALNLDVREAFLDVHYRSRSEALIGFSNETFYHDRLQPIPGHPKNRALRAPIILHRVDGVYKERTNPAEAAKAVEIVAELLSEEAPPSIGIACFNLTQRAEILEALDTRAQKDAQFARRLEEAKKRRGRDSFEGLFVKNLENVQGDERDVMIISTTFGPDEKGSFRRNFGALSLQTGGRRLNVLVTRARQAIHLLTSIPRTEYLSPTPLEEGKSATGRHHLYAYLRYAERLGELYEQYADALEKMRRDHVPQLEVQETATPSPVAVALARTLHQRHAIGSSVHWGNEGFCVDAALTHPEMPVDVTIGVLTDFTRFRKTPDPIEWDLFRTLVLRSQGWEIQRVWSPALFRNAPQLLSRISEQHGHAARRPDPASEAPLA